MQQIVDVFRLDAAKLDAAVDSAAAVRREDYWGAFLQGRIDEAMRLLGSEPQGAAARCDWHVDASVFTFARDGMHAAMEHQRRAEHEAGILLREMEGQRRRPTPAELAGRHRLLRLLQVNRAFFLVHSDSPADLAEAAGLADQWRSKSVADAGLRLAELRTRGLVLVHTGRVASGIAELRRAIGGSEPYWLRALGAVYLAYGHALQGDRRRSARYVRMAKRLAPQLPLLPARLTLVERALAAGRERAPSAPMR